MKRPMLTVLDVVGQAYAAGEMPNQPEWFKPLDVADEPDVDAVRRRRLNGLMSFAEDYLNAESDLAYELQKAKRGRGETWAIDDCRDVANAARGHLENAIEAMICSDPTQTANGGREGLIKWIGSMVDRREGSAA